MPEAYRRQFWQIVAPIALRVKDRELAEGLDGRGKPLKPISPDTRKRRRSAMTPDGKGDPAAPPLMPARAKSRTRALLAARALSTHVELYWRFDPFTGDQWSKVLTYLAEKGRDVFGISPKGMKRIAADSWAAWSKWRKANEQPELHAMAFANERALAQDQSYIAHAIAASATPGAGAKATAAHQAGAKSRKFATFGEGGKPSGKTLGGKTSAQLKAWLTAGLKGGTPPPAAPAAPRPPKPAPPPPAKPWTPQPGMFDLPTRGRKVNTPAEPIPDYLPTDAEIAMSKAKKAALKAAATRAANKAAGVAPKGRRKKAQAPAAAVPPPAAVPWPSDPDKLKVVRKLGGSTGAELVEDADGNRFVRKRGNSPEHLREEYHADEAYRAMGARVPEARLYERPGKPPIKLAVFVDGRTLGQVERDDPFLYKLGTEDLRRHFAADALLGNWDVIGAGKDNVLVDEQGQAWRIDNGGSLRYRAQGTLKTADQWDEYPVELWTLRRPVPGYPDNPQTAGVFGTLGIGDLAAQVRSIESSAAALEAALPQAVRATVKARLEQLGRVAKTAEAMIADRFHDAYPDDLTRHQMMLRKAGIAARMPAEMKPAQAGDVTPRDENGKDWDHLRGSGSLVEDLKRYVEGLGGNYKTISKWAGSQAGSSWSIMPTAIKAWIADQRSVPDSEYYWHVDRAKCSDELRKMEEFLGGGAAGRAAGAQKLRDTFVALHAFTLEYLEKASFPGKSADGRTARLIRTESSVVLGGLQPGDSGILKRGAMESTSIFRSIVVKGSHVTLQDVPLHRVLGTYWQEREPGNYGSGMFLGDGENEFVALLEGIPSEYKGTASYKTPH